MKELDEINKQIDEFIKKGDASFRKEEASLLKKIKDILVNYLSGGILLRDEISEYELFKQIDDLLVGAASSFNAFGDVDDFIPLFDEVASSLGGVIKAQNKGVKFSKNIVNMTQEKKIAIDLLSSKIGVGKTIKSDLTAPIKQILFSSINNNATYEDAVSLLKNYVVGDSAKGGMLSKHYKTIARDSLNSWQGMVNQKVSNVYGLIDFMYVGGSIKTTRPQCLFWVYDLGGKLIREIVEHEVKLAAKSVPRGNSKFSGYSINYYPTLTSFAYVRGGHNCRHQAIPMNFDTDEAQEILNKYNVLRGVKLKLKYTEIRNN